MPFCSHPRSIRLGGDLDGQGERCAMSDRKPCALYRPRDPQASDLWRLNDRHFDLLQKAIDYWRRTVMQSTKAVLKCRDLHE